MENKKESKRSKDIWKKIGIFIILAFLFFWFFIRPSIIKSNCANRAKEGVNKSEIKTMKNYDNYYTICLREKGL